MSSFHPIIITGFMGSGKTTVARALARLLQCEMIDLDQFITEQLGRSPKTIIDQDGEPAFRELETRFLTEILAQRAARVVALGGGAWTTMENRLLIEEYQGQAVWLDAPFELCWQRIAAAGSERPLARDQEQARNLYQERRPIYQTAKLHLETSEAISDEAAAAWIVDALGQR
jgi:shikimate kinase